MLTATIISHPVNIRRGDQGLYFFPGTMNRQPLASRIGDFEAWIFSLIPNELLAGQVAVLDCGLVFRDAQTWAGFQPNTIPLHSDIVRHERDSQTDRGRSWLAADQLITTKKRLPRCGRLLSPREKRKISDA